MADVVHADACTRNDTEIIMLKHCVKYSKIVGKH